MDVNKCILTGTVVRIRDRGIIAGEKACEFVLALRFDTEKRTDCLHIPIFARGSIGEQCAHELDVERRVAVLGEINVRRGRLQRIEAISLRVESARKKTKRN
ncbi:hypothetical protein [Chitinasiproducens palmae]|uniref:Single-stranded DNA-binding protein n=1 Tax=Chitinasiproducens palmae TaxID=1770053 RepID=A0A1H2PUH8_9BURK|nr:hypothetical protein [Chitinasiproducens palmae]SDV50838.1 hypothetical protein SAMN05216551_113154 [Chitinasiproducens palmae]